MCMDRHANVKHTSAPVKHTSAPTNQPTHQPTHQTTTKPQPNQTNQPSNNHTCTQVSEQVLLPCTLHDPCCLSPSHQVWKGWLHWFVPALSGTKLGRSQLRAGLVERLSRAPTSLCPISSPPEEMEKRDTAINVLSCNVSTLQLGFTKW